MRYSKFNERKQRGTTKFPIQLYSVDSNYPQYVMPLHWHNELELVFVKSGKLDLFINNQPFSLEAGDIAFVNCNHLHRAEPADCEYECIVCDLSMLFKSNDIASLYISPIKEATLTINPLMRADHSSVYKSVTELFEVMRKEGEYYELKTLSALFKTFEELYADNRITQSVQTDKSITQSQRIADMVMWIDNNYTERITLDTLSEQSGLTPNYICRVFKEYTGNTPINYINSVRIKNVCYDLKRAHKNVTEAALDNGFDDISYFCKVFKSHMGMSAKEYKKSLSKL